MPPGYRVARHWLKGPKAGTTETLIDANRATQTPFDPLAEDEWPGIYAVAIENPRDPRQYLFPVYLKLSEALPVECLLSSRGGDDLIVLEIAALSVQEAAECAAELAEVPSDRKR